MKNPKKSIEIKDLIRDIFNFILYEDYKIILKNISSPIGIIEYGGGLIKIKISLYGYK